MEIYERLMDFPGFDLEADLKRYSTEGIPDKVKLESFKRLREAAAHAFHVQLYDESNQQQPGLTRGEIVALLYDFGLWVDEIKKKQDSSPTIAPSTEPVSSGGASPISNTSASGSTETASSAETQAPLPSGSPLPSGPSCPIVSLAGLGTTAEMPIACAPSTAPHKVG
jgi:hypothetical protein